MNNLLLKKTYSIWKGMKRRTTDPNRKDAKNYIDKGISYQKNWKSFDNFLEDMGVVPTLNHSLDRISNKKSYGKKNCRWATKTEQNNNRSNIKQYKYNGEKGTITYFANKYKLNPKLLYQKMFRDKLTLKQAITKHIKRKNNE